MWCFIKSQTTIYKSQKKPKIQLIKKQTLRWFEFFIFEIYLLFHFLELVDNFYLVILI